MLLGDAAFLHCQSRYLLGVFTMFILINLICIFLFLAAGWGFIPLGYGVAPFVIFLLSVLSLSTFIGTYLYSKSQFTGVFYRGIFALSVLFIGYLFNLAGKAIQLRGIDDASMWAVILYAVLSTGLLFFLRRKKD